MPELRVDSVTKRFGGVVALDDVTLSLERSERRALIGPNGAGKSTLFNVISGETRPTAGAVELAGTRTTGLAPERVARMGLARTFQTSSLFLEATVLENVLLALLPTQGAGWNVVTPLGRFPKHERLAREALASVGLIDKAGDLAGSLSHGESRQLELAGALAQTPRLLLLDEPLAGLASADRTHIGGLLESLPRELTILLIEHDLEFAAGFADRMTVLHNGHVLAEGSPAEVRSNPGVIEVYLGGGKETSAAADSHAGEVLLDVRGLRAGYGEALVLEDVSLEVRKGEVVALLGRNGMGKTTLLHTLMGFLMPSAGSISLVGKDLTHASVLSRARCGLALVPQGRHMLTGLRVSEELALGPRPGPWDLERAYKLFPQLRQRAQQSSVSLSGGEQQMLAIARAMLRNPALLLMDEPSEGLSPALVRALEATISSLRADGETVLLAEQNIDLALAVADRVYILEHGRVVEHDTARAFAAQRSRLEKSLGV
jgi:ABC-type branched-subunit amino acid transport system ATPase component